MVGYDLAVRLSSRGGGLCLCALGICSGGLKMLTLVCTCRFCFVLFCFNRLEKLVQTERVTGIWENRNILKRTSELDTCVYISCQESPDVIN